jgi:hypothetical protein
MVEIGDTSPDSPYNVTFLVREGVQGSAAQATSTTDKVPFVQSIVIRPL